MRCERCGSDDMIVINVQLGDGSKILFSSCPTCESKVWQAGSGRVSLQEVLQLASTHRPR